MPSLIYRCTGCSKEADTAHEIAIHIENDCPKGTSASIGKVEAPLFLDNLPKPVPEPLPAKRLPRYVEEYRKLLYMQGSMKP